MNSLKNEFCSLIVFILIAALSLPLFFFFIVTVTESMQHCCFFFIKHLCHLRESHVFIVISLRRCEVDNRQGRKITIKTSTIGGSMSQINNNGNVSRFTYEKLLNICRNSEIILSWFLAFDQLQTF